MSAGSNSSGVAVAGFAALDATGISGTALRRAEFGEGGLRALKWKQLFALPNPAYRHLDLFGRCVALTTEAAGIARVLPEEDRRATALVLATGFGCLQSDLDFARSLQPDERISPALFPYTLPSTCLGEVAIRHRLQGPLSCLMPGPEASLEVGLLEARRLIVRGEARAAVVSLGDCVLPESAAALDVPARLAVAGLILRPAQDVPSPVLDWQQLLAAGGRVEWMLERLRELDSDSSADGGEA